MFVKNLFKMKIPLKPLLIFIALLLFNACSVGYFPNQKYTPFNQLSKNQTEEPCVTIPENVELVFEGEKINFEYEKIGLFEVQGDQSSNDAELIASVKKYAQSKCCDAVINLKMEYINREKGFLYGKEKLTNYSAKVFIGILVKKKK